MTTAAFDDIVDRLNGNDLSPDMIDFAMGRPTVGAQRVVTAVQKAANPFVSDPERRARVLARRAERRDA